MIHTLCVTHVLPAKHYPVDLEYRYRPGVGSYVFPRVRPTEDTAYTYYDGFGMIAHNGYLFKLENPDKFQRFHNALATYKDGSSPENFRVWSKTARDLLSYRFGVDEDDVWEDHVEYADNQLILIQKIEGDTYLQSHSASASKETYIKRESPWDSLPDILYVSLTMPALRCIQRFFRKHAPCLLAQRKFAAFLIYGNRQTDTLQRVDDDVLKIIMNLAGP